MTDSSVTNQDSNPSPGHWIRLLPVSRCRPGAGTFIEHNGKELGVFVLGADEVIVLDNACPHSGGNLSAGEVAGGVVTCPWHHWQFNLSTGLCIDSPAARVQKYAARIRGGWVEVSSSAR